MNGRQFVLEEMKWMQVREAASRRPIVIIPTGSIEQHGPHLPLQVDSLIASELARATAASVQEHLSVLVAPTLSFGCSEEHMDFAGTLSLSPQTFITVAVETIVSLMQHGFDRFFFLDAHAGNMDALRLIVRILRSEKKVLAAAGAYWDIAREAMLSLPGGTVAINHGGEVETSLMLHLRSDLVDMAAAAPNPLRWRTKYLAGGKGVGPSVSYGRMRRDIAPLGANGDPTLASAEKGRMLFDVIVQALGCFLADFQTWELTRMTQACDQN